MRITVRSSAGVFYRREVLSDLEAVLVADELAVERRRVERGLHALVLREEGLSYGQIARAPGISKTTACRRVEDARHRYRKAAEACGEVLVT